MKKKCCRCKKSKNIDKYNLNSSRKDGIQSFCIDCQRLEWKRRYKKNLAHERERGKTKYRQVRQLVFDYYGAQCVCCGETEFDFLTIDHVNNDGAKDRFKPYRGGTGLYYLIKKNNFPNIYQVLCMNCNLSKHLNGGICIHKIKNEQN